MIVWCHDGGQKHLGDEGFTLDPVAQRGPPCQRCNHWWDLFRSPRWGDFVLDDAVHDAFVRRFSMPL